jgi:nucleotide-binding universal stress UspA family protein
VIVVGIDGSKSSPEILRFALYEATLRGTRLRAVRAWAAVRRVTVTGPGVVPLLDPDAVREEVTAELGKLVDAVAGDRAVDVERVVVEGPAGEAILRHAHDAELIVVGTRAYGALAEIVLGSVSRHVVRHARCPVVVVPPQRGT